MYTDVSFQALPTRPRFTGRASSLPPDSPIMTPRYAEAMAYARQLHQGQFRKGTNITYFDAHLYPVSQIAIALGEADEDEAIAALLHDAVEDQGGEQTLCEIRRRFGNRVANIVEECTDTDQIPKPPWRERKARYIQHVKTKSESGLLVSSADKIHNAESILEDLRQRPTLAQQNKFWRIFKAGKEGTIWYYEALISAFRTADHYTPRIERMVARLETAVRQIKAQAF